MMSNYSNPMQLIQSLQRSANPQQMIMQMARNNPAIQRALNLVNGRTPEQIYGMAQQMAQRLGENLGQMAQQMGVRMPK